MWSLPFLLEQSKIVLIPETLTKVETFAQRSLVRKAQFQQQTFGALIHIINHRFDTMQAQLSESIGEDGRHCLAHNALPPEGAIKLIACLSVLGLQIEKIETTGANHPVLALACDSPANALAPRIPLMLLPDQLARVIHSSMRQMPIEFHHLFIRESREERFRVLLLNLPEPQALRFENREMGKHRIDGHRNAPYLSK